MSFEGTPSKLHWLQEHYDNNWYPLLANILNVNVPRRVD